jgi:hypothetical protein
VLVFERASGDLECYLHVLGETQPMLPHRRTDAEGDLAPAPGPFGVRAASAAPAAGDAAGIRQDSTGSGWVVYVSGPPDKPRVHVYFGEVEELVGRALRHAQSRGEAPPLRRSARVVPIDVSGDRSPIDID